MGRVAGLANSIRNSGVRLGPVDAVFAGADYLQGKQDGEDDVRAVVGAAGSTLGGWGGAAAGAGVGATIGAFGGPVGVAVGGALGAIAGGTIGGFAGGWGADRVDETIRGNKNNMATFNQPYQEYDNRQQGGFGLDQAAGLGLLSYGGFKGLQGIGQELKAANYNPIGGFNHYQNAGNGTRQAAQEVAKDGLAYAKQGLGRTGKLPKVAGATGALLLANNLLGNPLGKVLGGTVDMITGGRTNWDGNPEDERKQQQLRQMQNDVDVQRKQQQMSTPTQQQNDSALADMYSNPNFRLVKQEGLEAQKRQQDNEQKIFNRDRKASLETQRYALAAQNSRDIMSAWSDSARNVNSAMQTINSARF